MEDSKIESIPVKEVANSRNRSRPEGTQVTATKDGSTADSPIQRPAVPATIAPVPAVSNPMSKRTAYDLPEAEQKIRTSAHELARSHLQTLRQSSIERFDQAVLTLSSTLLAASLAFIKDVVPLAQSVMLWMLVTSWVLFAVSILSVVSSFVVSGIALDAQLTEAYDYYIGLDEGAFNRKHLAKTITDFLNWVSAVSFVAAISCTIYFVSVNALVRQAVERTTARHAAVVPAQNTPPLSAITPSPHTSGPKAKSPQTRKAP